MWPAEDKRLDLECAHKIFKQEMARFKAEKEEFLWCPTKRLGCWAKPSRVDFTKVDVAILKHQKEGKKQDRYIVKWQMQNGNVFLLEWIPTKDKRITEKEKETEELYGLEAKNVIWREYRSCNRAYVDEKIAMSKAWDELGEACGDTSVYTDWLAEGIIGKTWAERTLGIDHK